MKHTFEAWALKREGKYFAWVSKPELFDYEWEAESYAEMVMSEPETRRDMKGFKPVPVTVTVEEKK